MIVFIHGPDALLVRQHLKDVLNRLDPGGENTSRVDGRTTSPQAIAGMVATPSFFGTSRVVVVDDLFAKSGKSGGDDDDEGDTSTSSRSNSAAIELLSQVVDPNALVLVEPSLKSVPAAIKKAGVGIEIKMGIPPRGRDLERWVRDQAKVLGTSFDGNAAIDLLEAMAPGNWREANRNPAYDVPPDLDAINQEVAKLATSAHPNPITSELIAGMTASANADQLFPLLSELFRGNLAGSLRLLADAIDQGEDHYRLLAQIFGQSELSLPIEAGRGQDPEAVGRDLGLSNPRRMSAIARPAMSHPLSGRLAAITAIDRGQKNGELRNTDDTLFALLDTIARQ